VTAKPQKASKATGRLKGMVTFLDGLKPEEAQAVLQRFLAAHPDLCAEVQRIAHSLLREISFGAVADNVEDAVRAVDFDDLRGRAGRHEGGYVEPDQAALDLFGQAVDPFFEDMKHKLKLGLEAEALEICKGIVLGLYRVRDDEGGELLRWVPEFPEESAGWAADIWRAGGDERKATRRTRPLPGKGRAFPEDFVKRFVPEWRWLIKEKPART
jgi:hypothetical protein